MVVESPPHNALHQPPCPDYRRTLYLLVSSGRKFRIDLDDPAWMLHPRRSAQSTSEIPCTPREIACIYMSTPASEGGTAILGWPRVAGSSPMSSAPLLRRVSRTA